MSVENYILGDKILKKEVLCRLVVANTTTLINPSIKTNTKKTIHYIKFAIVTIICRTEKETQIYRTVI